MKKEKFSIHCPGQISFFAISDVMALRVMHMVTINQKKGRSKCAEVWMQLTVSSRTGSSLQSSLHFPCSRECHETKLCALSTPQAEPDKPEINSQLGVHLLNSEKNTMFISSYLNDRNRVEAFFKLKKWFYFKTSNFGYARKCGQCLHL